VAETGGEENLMLRTRRALAKALVASMAATVLVVGMAPDASAVSCNDRSWIISDAANAYTSTEIGYSGGLNGMLRARASTPGTWEEYSICGWWDTQYNTRVQSIRSHRNGRYVTAEFGYTGVDNGMLRARATSIGIWEKFKVEQWGPNGSMYTIRSLRYSRYVSTERGYGGVRHNMLRARASSIGPWEKYFILCGVPAACWF
jgi:hypothetical protein